jgi:hypothetical protein
MKIVIDKQFDEVGGKWLREQEVVADIYMGDDKFIVSMSDVRYSIPIIAVKAVIEVKKEE